MAPYAAARAAENKGPAAHRDPACSAHFEALLRFFRTTIVHFRRKNGDPKIAILNKSIT